MQLQERRAGNTAYQQQQFSTALHHYQRALAVVNFVVGQTPHDQAEVDYNKATVLLNMAAVHMALKVTLPQGPTLQNCSTSLYLLGSLLTIRLAPAYSVLKCGTHASKCNSQVQWPVHGLDCSGSKQSVFGWLEGCPAW